MAISLTKIEQTAPSLLKKVEAAVAAVNKARLNGTVAKVVVVMDRSGSMYEEYESGAVQRAIEKALALATQFDDDGNIDFFIFDSGAAYLGEIGLGDFSGSVKRLLGNRSYGSTNYAAGLYNVRDHFGFTPPAPVKKGLFGAFKTVEPPQSTPADMPVYAIFVTDGSPDSEDEAKAALTSVSTAPIFWKFISIGPSKMRFLQTLDDLRSRYVDNADYQHIDNIDQISDADLFDKLLEEFPEWIAQVRSKGLIR